MNLRRLTFMNARGGTTLAPLILLAFFILILGACSSDDDEPLIEEEPMEELESAVAMVYRIQSTGTDSWFIEAYEDIPSEVVISEATEVGQAGTTVNALGDAVFVWNGEGLVTKWAVDRTNLDITEDGTIDVSSLGMEGDIGTIIKKTDTEAYLIDNKIGTIVEFNPEIMEVVEVINYPAYQPTGWTPEDPTDAFINTFQHRLIDDFIMAPFLTLDLTNWRSPYAAIMFVFNTNTNEAEFVFDDRISNGNDRFIEAPTGEIYQPAGWHAGLLLELGDHDPNVIPSSTSILRFNRDGTWDENFELDIADIDPGTRILWRPQFVVGNEIVVSYWPPETEIRSDERNGGIFSQSRVAAIIDLDTQESRPFTSLDQYNGFNIIGEFKGTTYIGAFPVEGPNILVRQDDIESYTEVLTSAEGVSLRQVRQLW
ncbi:MAG: hypothetical protein AAF600_06560 [Bacteroidota bacterium]